MIDPSDVVLNLSAGGLGALLMKLFGASAARNVKALDTTIEHLDKSITDTSEKLTKTIEHLSVEVQKLREAHIGLAKDVGALQQGHKDLEQRIAGQAEFYRKLIEDHRAAVDLALSKGRRK